MKTPYLSINQKLLLLAAAALFFGLTPVIHAGGLSGLKDSLNKGKINKNEVEPAAVGQPDEVSEPAAVKASAKIKRITDPATQKGKPKFVFVNKKRSESKVKPPKSKKEEAKEFNEKLKNDYNKMLVTLKQARKKKKASPRIAAVRIEDNPEDSSIPAKLPEDFLNVDTDELAIRNEVKTLYDSFESLSLDYFNKACDNLYGKYYKTRPDICHLIKLIKADAKLKKDPNYALEDQMLRMLRWPSSFEPVPYPTFQTSMHEEYLKMSRDTETGNDIIKFVNKKAKKRQEQIKKANDDFLIVIRNEINVLNKLKADYESYVKDLLSLTHILPGYTVTYENNPEYLQRVMKYAIDDIKAHYQKISQRYLIIAIYLNSAGQWEESLNLTKEFKDYFEKNCPYKFTIKFAGKIDYDEAVSSGNLGNLKILQGDLLIDKDNLKWGPKRFDQAALECMSRLSLQNITDQINNLEFHKKIIDFAEANIEDQEEIKAYKKESKIKEIRFETNEFSGVSSPSKIYAADDKICLKCYYEPGYNQFYQKPIEIDLKSSVSNRNKKITIISSRSESAPYTIFQPNETDDPKDNVKNLINNEKDAYKDSIAAAECLPELFNTLLVYDCGYFKKIMGYGYFNQATINPIKKIIKLSIPFLKSGGFEFVYAKMNTLEALSIVRNQADWLLIAGHGNEATGSIGMEDHNSLSDVIVRPTSDIETYNPTLGKHTIFGLLRKDGTSEYDEDIDVLILSVCSVLKRRKNIDAWHNVLPNGLILGYCGKTKTLPVNNVIKQIYSFLNSADQPVSKALILQKWKEFNLLEIISFVSIFTSKYDGILSYAYITNNICVQHEAKRVPFSKYTPFLAGKIITMKKIIKLK